ncbi:MAG: hypothetical protein M3Q39_15945 [Actinomycetota bacterium]|nr:hypothetical protein [Actinomycetota bacterium]
MIEWREDEMITVSATLPLKPAHYWERAAKHHRKMGRAFTSAVFLAIDKAMESTPPQTTVQEAARALVIIKHLEPLFPGADDYLRGALDAARMIAHAEQAAPRLSSLLRRGGLV